MKGICDVFQQVHLFLNGFLLMMLVYWLVLFGNVILNHMTSIDLLQPANHKINRFTPVI